MPLNLTVNEGDFTPFIKYNAKAGRWYAKFEGQASEVEIINPRLLFDMLNIRTGWLYYAEGSGPEKVWDPDAFTMAERPPGPRKFKRGFEVMVLGNDNIPGAGPLGLREFSSTAGNVITPILQMYDEYEAGVKEYPGQLPFYACTGVVPISGHYGTNYEPRFQLTGWVERAKVPAFDEARANSNGGSPVGMVAPAGQNMTAPGAPPEAATGGGAALDDEIPFGPARD